VPDGYIISSASDMTHYLTAEMNGGVYHGTRVASAQAMREPREHRASHQVLR
jgi:CubicO group peptidase (beta-lactamase class C family)